MRIGLATPHAHAAKPEFNRLLIEAQHAAPHHAFVYVEVELMIIGKARNMCVEVSQQEKLDAIFFVDDDVYVTKEVAQLFEQAPTLKIVSGVYFQRFLPYTPQVYIKATEPEYKGKYWPMIEMPEKGLFQADAVGGGCLVVMMDVLQHMENHYRPFFEEQSKLLADEWLASLVRNMSPWFEFLDRKGEDIYFCELAKRLGYNIWVNADVQCGHVGELVVTREHFNYLRDNNLLRKEPKS